MTYAIYFEFRKQAGDAYQAIFIPAVLLNGSHVIEPTYCYKHLSAAHARRAWNVHPKLNYTPNTDPEESIVSLMSDEIRQLDGPNVYMTSVLVDPDWRAEGSFPVELTNSDYLSLKENSRRVPVGLNQRIKELRLEKGFSPLPVAS